MPAESTQIEEQMTVADIFKGMEEWGAGVIKLIASDGADKPLRAVIAVTGEGVGEIVEAVEAVERRWDEEGDSDGQREDRPGVR